MTEVSIHTQNQICNLIRTKKIELILIINRKYSYFLGVGLLVYKLN